MLENFVKLSELDDGIRNLVIHMAKIQGVILYTNCEGHVWRGINMWPTKEGWLHFDIESEGKTYSLLREIRNFCNRTPHFRLEGPNNCPRTKGFESYTIEALYDRHPEQTTAEVLDTYWRKSDRRHFQHLVGWHKLNTLVADWIRVNLNEHPALLPFREEGSNIVEDRLYPVACS